MSDAIYVNGNQYSWGSLVCKVADERYYGFDLISFGDKRERAKSYGMTKNQAPRGRSRGKYIIEPVKIRGPVSSVMALRNGLAAQSSDQRSYGNIEFQIVLDYFEEEEDPITVEIDGVTWVSSAASHEENQEILKEDVELDAMRIYRNGLTLFDSSLAA